VPGRCSCPRTPCIGSFSDVASRCSRPRTPCMCSFHTGAGTGPRNRPPCTCSFDTGAGTGSPCVSHLLLSALLLPRWGRCCGPVSALPPVFMSPTNQLAPASEPSTVYSSIAAGTRVLRKDQRPIHEDERHPGRRSSSGVPPLAPTMQSVQDTWMGPGTQHASGVGVLVIEHLAEFGESFHVYTRFIRWGVSTVY
jgi:hypothetical protein